MYEFSPATLLFFIFFARSLKDTFSVASFSRTIGSIQMNPAWIGATTARNSRKIFSRGVAFKRLGEPSIGPLKDHYTQKFSLFVQKNTKSQGSSKRFSTNNSSEEFTYKTNSKNMSITSNNEQGVVSITDELAAWLVQGKIPPQIHPSISLNNPKRVQHSMKACLAIAGGGSKAASSIASVPGASSVLLESVVPYDRRSFAEFVTNNLSFGGVSDESSDNEYDSSWFIELQSMGEKRLDKSFSVVSSSASDEDNNNKMTSKTESSGIGGSFHFCSTEAAILLSKAALNRSMQLSPRFQDKSLHCIGVACTSSLVGKLLTDGVELTEKERRMSARKSKAFIACTTSKNGTWAWDVELSCGENGIKQKDCSVADVASIGRRTRSQEETIVSNLILLSMLKHREDLDMTHDKMTSMMSRILNREGDAINERFFGQNQLSKSMHVDMPSNSPALGAQKIIDGEANIVAVVPVQSIFSEISNSDKQIRETHEMQSLFADNLIPLPNDVLIVPGSFNPPHHGHIALANAAVAALQRLRLEDESNIAKSYSRYSSHSSNSSISSSILDSIWTTVQKHSIKENQPAVFFELSVTNADKPPLDPSEVERRLNLFLELPPSDLPNDWGVILTNAPLFSQKTSILSEIIPGDPSSGSNRKLTFVLGTDTFVRIINPKYYENSEDNMVAALTAMKERGVHFIVGGRLEQGIQGERPKFVSGEEELLSLPSNVQDIFTILKEEDFRVDVSSTELRNKIEKESKNR